jgi:hypothetical protein
MEVTLPKRSTSRIISPECLADSDKNYEIMESFNQVYSIIKVGDCHKFSKTLLLCLQEVSLSECCFGVFLLPLFQTAEERNLAESFALWALRAAIRGAMSQENGQLFSNRVFTVILMLSTFNSRNMFSKLNESRI